MTIAGERGSSLLGELIAIAIIVLALTVLLSGLATGSRGTQIVESRISAENYARQQLETIKNAPYDAAGAYPTVAPSGVYSIELQSSHWVSSTNTFADGAATTDGLQRFRIMVHSSMRLGEPIYTLEGFKADRP
ncbi:MAG: hypothetical protein ACYC4R_17245 [Anaerolineae bacterium]